MLATASNQLPLTLDRRYMGVVLAMLMTGLVMVYSANLPLPSSNAETIVWAQLKGHPLHVVLGLLAFALAFRISSDDLHRYSGLLFTFGLLLLLVVLGFKFIGGESFVRDGAVRSIPVGPLTFQPSELMKLLAIIFAAAYAVRRHDRMREDLIKGLAPIGLLMVIVTSLLMAQPDLGTTVVITVTVAAVLLLGGMSLRVVIPLVILLVTFFALAIYLTPFRVARIMSYLTPCEAGHAQAAGYQLCGALIAFGHGGLFGSGLGTGVAKLGYLPLPHTDFIFAVIGEELGFVGVTALLLGFAYLIRYCIQVGRLAMSQERLFAGLVAQGIGVWIGVQTFIHSGVNTGLLPTKGLTLPLISYGGSSMLVVCFALGVVARIDAENRAMARGRRIGPLGPSGAAAKAARDRAS